MKYLMFALFNLVNYHSFGQTSPDFFKILSPQFEYGSESDTILMPDNNYLIANYNSQQKTISQFKYDINWNFIILFKDGNPSR
jgi:hypothetical protein